MNVPCPNRIDCPGTDSPFTNYSAEGGEAVMPFFALQFPVWPTENPGDPLYRRSACFTTCESTESQLEADLCALRLMVECTDPNSIYSSHEATCTFTLSDGTVFTFVLPPASFFGPSQAIADALADALACEEASNPDSSTRSSRVRLGALNPCWKKGTGQSASVPFSGTVSLWSLVSGSLPPGLTFSAGVVSGIPTTAGNYTFTIRAYAPKGSYGQKAYTIRVLDITTTSLPDFASGVEYEFQLTAAGGSGHYTWTLIDGELPEGLTLDPDGVISGTPV